MHFFPGLSEMTLPPPHPSLTNSVLLRAVAFVNLEPKKIHTGNLGHLFYSCIFPPPESKLTRIVIYSDTQLDCQEQVAFLL